MFDPISLGLGYGAWKLGKYIYEEFNKPFAPPNPWKEAEIKELTAEPIFFAVAILAKFAKADGIVTKNEVATIEQILRDIDLTGEDRKKAISIFSKHKNGALSYEESLTILATLAQNDLDFRVGLCILLLRLAHADGTPPQRAIQGVQHACNVLGIDYVEVHEVFQQQERHRRAAINADFEVLGCSPNDSTETIKKRYRELTKTFHPDTMSGKDLHPEITKLAVAKFREIQDAYERVMAQRQVPKANTATQNGSSEPPQFSAQVFLHYRGEKHGPFTLAKVQWLLGSGSIPDNATFWAEGMSEWRPISTFHIAT